MCKVYSREWFMLNIIGLESLYYKNGCGCSSFSIPYDKRTSYEVEDKAEIYEANGKIDTWIMAWIFGRVDDSGNILLNDDGSIRNTYGKSIYGLEKYLKSFDINEIKSAIDEGDLRRAFTGLAQNSPKNLGTVYIITLMHFISKGKIPIYDKFAHIAVKALYANIKPSQVYVGCAPEKNNVRDSINMLNEYIWLLDKVFGTSEIDKTIDRALWVYGHENGKKENVKFLIQY